ncbi:MAG: M3 family oligoendopeptidase [Anaerolineales bacterium]|nr:M3 family oligoendopeptidase [Anaerolineales bacterium]
MPPTAPAAEALPHWDLSNVYPSLESDEFAEAVAQLSQQLEALEAYLDQHRITRTTNGSAAGLAPLGAAAMAAVVNGSLERFNRLMRLSTTVQTYVRAIVATDSFNTQARRWQSRLEPASVRLRRASIRFQGWLGAHAALLPEALAQAGPAQEHTFVLRELAEQSRYLMSEPEESLAAELSLSGGPAWSKLQGTIASQLGVPFEHDGQSQVLPVTALQNLMWYHPQAEVRRRAYEAELAAWASVREPLAAALNGVKGHVVTLNQRRGRTDALHQALDDARLDRATLDTLLGAIQASWPAFRRYLQAKARRLGHTDGMPWWDLHAQVAPPAPGGARRFSFAEAQRFIGGHFGRFAPSLAALAQRAFAKRWIDAEPRAGKRGGAFCMWLPTVGESRVLCNFDGSLDQLFTIAHELGHAYHNQCLAACQPLQRVTPMTLAETASTFCETLITDAAMAAAASPAEEISILETFLIGATQIVVDIPSRYLFEKEVFERRAEAELSADDFCELMLRCQAATYGDGLDARYRHPYMWAWKPHYYRTELSFYNFPYAFGLLFGLGLYAVYQQRGPGFVAEYEALLASTGQAPPADLAARFGLDLRRPEFWQASLAVIEQRIDQYLARG